MTWAPLTIIWTNRAERDLKRLARDVQKRVTDAVEAFASAGAGQVEKMKDGSGHKLRVGTWRVGVAVELRAGQITVIWVSKRGDAY